MVQDDETTQSIVKEYIFSRRLERPKTTKLVVAIMVFLNLFIPASLCIVSYIISVLFTDSIIIICLIMTSFLISFIPLLHITLIEAIKCYQHYAPAYVRRSCLCKPTCSEYAISVLQKYIIVVALWKIYIRLHKTCTGYRYKIDEP